MKRNYGSQRYDGTQSKKYRLLPSHKDKAPAPINPILATMGSPFSDQSKGGRLPDGYTGTVTGSYLLEVTQTINAQGCTGGLLFLSSGATVYSEEFANSGDTNAEFCCFQSNILGKTGNVVYNSGTWVATPNPSVAGTTYNKLLPGWNSTYGNYSALRITGAAIQVEFIGNDQNNQGLITTFQPSWSDQELTSNAASLQQTFRGQPWYTTQAAIENHRTEFNGPLKDGANVSWVPTDTDDLIYGTVPRMGNYGDPTTSILVPPVTGAFVGLVTIPLTRTWGWESPVLFASDKNVRNYGNLGFHVSGGASGQKVRVSLIVHTEQLPLLDYGVGGAEVETCDADASMIDSISCLVTQSTGTSMESKALADARATLYETTTRAIKEAATDAAKEQIRRMAKKVVNEDSIATIWSVIKQISKAWKSSEDWGF